MRDVSGYYGGGGGGGVTGGGGRMKKEKKRKKPSNLSLSHFICLSLHLILLLRHLKCAHKWSEPALCHQVLPEQSHAQADVKVAAQQAHQEERHPSEAANGRDEVVGFRRAGPPPWLLFLSLL
jgi:hypothetical protein